MTYLHQTSRRRRPSQFFPVEAEELLRAGEVMGATELCKHGLVYFPENISGYAVLAQAYLMLDQPERALNVLEDGYRRTKAEGLRALCDGVLQADTSQVEPEQEEISEAAIEEIELEVEAVESEIEVEEVKVEKEASESILERKEKPTVSTEAALLPNDKTEGKSLDSAISDETAQEVVSESTFVPEETVEERVISVELVDSEVGDVQVEEPHASENEEESEDLSPEEIEVSRESIKQSSGLSIHSGTNISRLRSSNLRLIPGLEFAPLRHDESKLKFAPLVNPAPPELDLPISGKEEVEEADIVDLGIELPEEEIETIPETVVEEPVEEKTESEDVLRSHSLDLRTPLEELARRLETARIPIVEEEEETQADNLAFEPSIVSDTFAGILAQQGAYDEAIKAYQMLARVKPERRADYEQKIEEMRWKKTSVTNEGTGSSEEESPEL